MHTTAFLALTAAAVVSGLEFPEPPGFFGQQKTCGEQLFGSWDCTTVFPEGLPFISEAATILGIAANTGLGIEAKLKQTWTFNALREPAPSSSQDLNLGIPTQFYKKHSSRTRANLYPPWIGLEIADADTNLPTWEGTCNEPTLVYKFLRSQIPDQAICRDFDRDEEGCNATPSVLGCYWVSGFCADACNFLSASQDDCETADPFLGCIWTGIPTGYNGPPCRGSITGGQKDRIFPYLGYCIDYFTNFCACKVKRTKSYFSSSSSLVQSATEFVCNQPDVEQTSWNNLPWIKYNHFAWDGLITNGGNNIQLTAVGIFAPPNDCFEIFCRGNWIITEPGLLVAAANNVGGITNPNAPSNQASEDIFCANNCLFPNYSWRAATTCKKKNSNGGYAL